MSSLNAFDFAAQFEGAELQVIGVCDGYDFQPTLPSLYILVSVNMDWGDGLIYNLQLCLL